MQSHDEFFFDPDDDEDELEEEFFSACITQDRIDRSNE
jgi:hypothetical protein